MLYDIVITVWYLMMYLCITVSVSLYVDALLNLGK